MVKVGPSANYYVRVRPYEWNSPSPDRDRLALYAGIFHVSLHYTVDVTFAPDVTALAPPWTAAALPPPGERIRTVGQARLAEAMASSYVVTPNRALAGSTETFAWSPDEGKATPTTVFYVSPAEFERYAADLDELSEVAGDVHSTVQVDDVRDHEVIRFIEQRIVDSPWLRPIHASTLGR